jgi:quercetin dioxygenase-like cupin family protein
LFSLTSFYNFTIAYLAYLSKIDPATANFLMAEHHGTNLRPTKRFITTHDNNGLAVFHNDIVSDLSTQNIPTGDKLSLAYATDQLPVDLAKDLGTYHYYLTNSPGFTIAGGTVLCQIDMAPGSNAPFHRTRSLDYCIVIEGTVHLVLDSGEVKTLQRGDMAIQRGTKHSWRNTSMTEWARMLFVLQDSLPVEVNSKTLEVDFGGIDSS